MNSGLSIQALAQRALHTDPRLAAIRHRGVEYDWGWMRDSGAAIIELLESVGASRNKPVGVVPRNRPTSAAALLALIADGRSVRIIFAFQSAGMLAQDVGRLDISAFIASDEDFSPPVCDALERAGLSGISLDEEAGIGLVTGFEEGPLRDRAHDESSQGLTGAPVIEVLTSGMTGAPRHFPISQDVIVQNLLRTNLSYPARSQSHDVSIPTLVFFPLSTLAGLYSYLPPALEGHSVVLQEQFDLDGWLGYVAQYQPQRMTLPPAALESLLRREIAPSVLSCIKYIGTGSAPIDVKLQARFEDRFGIPLLISYGATEFGGPVSAMTPELVKRWGSRKRGSAGAAWGGARLRVVDQKTGRELPTGAVGILEVVAPAVGQDWIRTGDLAMIDVDGFLFHRGRADGAITRDGFSMLPQVIEAALTSHPKVLAAAVVGLPHPRLGELPVAAVQPADPDNPPSVAELEQFLGDRLFAVQVPAQFRFVPSLPRTASRKVDLRKVRALFQRESR